MKHFENVSCPRITQLGSFFGNNPSGNRQSVNLFSIIFQWLPNKILFIWLSDLRKDVSEKAAVRNWISIFTCTIPTDAITEQAQISKSFVD